MSNVIDFNAHKDKKVIADELARGRTPLFISHKDGKIIGSGDPNKKLDSTDFGDRLTRIKTSLEKINRLMRELRMASDDGKGLSNVKPISSSKTKLPKK